MIGVATKSYSLSALVSRFFKKETESSLFFTSKRARASLSRGYVVISSERSLFVEKIITSGGTRESFVGLFCNHPRRQLSTEEDLKSLNFERISNETLESLSEYFDEIIEEADHLPDADVSCGDGVLTVKFGKEYGTYVLNRQVPNQQIWLSSPKSGPKRYDFIDGTWIYKHDGKSLQSLLNKEIPDIVKFPVFFEKCFHGLRNK